MIRGSGLRIPPLVTSATQPATARHRRGSPCHSFLQAAGTLTSTALHGGLSYALRRTATSMSISSSSHWWDHRPGVEDGSAVIIKPLAPVAARSSRYHDR
jgi:hypothetical protein